jgi:CheY-like chemotaxis protein
MPQKILVIDDDIVSQNMLRSTLTQAGYSVITASNGPEGIKKAREQPPDLIVLDIMMPGMDGGEVAGILKDDPGTKRIPIVFVSSLVTESKKNLNTQKNTITYLSKPFDRDELLDAVKRYLAVPTGQGRGYQ